MKMAPNGMGNSTDYKPRANNRLFGVKRGFRGDGVGGGKPFMIAAGIGTILI
jgi:hypothetical protein